MVTVALQTLKTIFCNRQRTDFKRFLEDGGGVIDANRYEITGENWAGIRSFRPAGGLTTEDYFGLCDALDPIQRDTIARAVIEAILSQRQVSIAAQTTILDQWAWASQPDGAALAEKLEQVGFETVADAVVALVGDLQEPPPATVQPRKTTDDPVSTNYYIPWPVCQKVAVILNREISYDRLRDSGVPNQLRDPRIGRVKGNIAYDLIELLLWLPRQPKLNQLKIPDDGPKADPAPNPKHRNEKAKKHELREETTPLAPGICTKCRDKTIIYTKSAPDQEEGLCKSCNGKRHRSRG